MFYGMNAWFLASLALGAMWWIAAVSAPVWKRLEGRAAAPAFQSAMRRGEWIFGGFLSGASALGFTAAGDDADLKWAVGAGFLVLALLVGLPMAAGPGRNLRALSDPAEFQDDEASHQSAVRASLKIWARLHLGRCLLASVGVFFFIWAAH